MQISVSSLFPSVPDPKPEEVSAAFRKQVGIKPAAFTAFQEPETRTGG